MHLPGPCPTATAARTPASSPPSSIRCFMTLRRGRFATLLLCALSAPTIIGCASTLHTPGPTPSRAPSASSTRATAPNGTPLFFYTGKDYGSEAAFNPFTELLNEGFDVLNDAYSRRLSEQRLDVGFRTVLRSVRNPGKVVRAYGGWGTSRASKNG